MSRIRLASLCTILGLGASIISLFRPHTLSFMLFLVLGVPLILLGAVLFVVGHRQEKSRAR